MAFSVHTSESSAEKIELHSNLSYKRTINETQHLVSCKNVLWVVQKVKNRDEILITNSLDAGVSEVPLLIKGHVVALFEDGVLQKVDPLLAFLWLVIP